MKSWVAWLVMIGCATPPHYVAGLEEPNRLHRAKREPSAPPELRLSHDFEPTGYRARLAFSENTFTGYINIGGDLAKPTHEIWLNSVGQQILSATATQDNITVPLGARTFPKQQVVALLSDKDLPEGHWTISIVYRAQFDVRHPNAHKLGVFRRDVGKDHYVFTMDEPIYARWIFPCIDEPDRKVPWQMSFDVSNDLTVVGNGAVISETPLDQTHKRVELAPTQPLPSYLVAFAIGPFAIVDAGKTEHGVPVRIATPRSSPPPAPWVAGTAAHLVDLISDYLDVPYPFAKLDLVAIPNTTISMENPGMITFSADVLNGDVSEWAFVASHEIAHQWFGDLVTPHWWNDIWLNESFADWVAMKVSDDARSVRAFDPIRDGLAQPSAQAIRPTYDTLRSLSFDTYSSSYNSRAGAALLNTLEAFIGEDRFRHGIHSYLVGHRYDLVTTHDLINAIADPKLTALVTSVVDHGLPNLFVTQDCKTATFAASLETTQQICFAYDKDGSRADTCAMLRGTSVTVPLEANACPKWLLPNANGVSLFVPRMPIGNERALIDLAWPQLTANEQRATVMRFSDDDLIVRAIPKLLRNPDAASRVLAARSLLERWTFVPDDLMPVLGAWIAKNVARPPTLAAAGDQIAIAGLFAMLGDKALVAEASQLVASYADLPLDVRMAALRITAPTIAPKLFEDAKRWDVFFALESSRDLIPSITANRAAFDRLQDRFRMLTFSCSSHDAEAIAIAASLPDVDKDAVADRLTACQARRKQVDPAFRAWLSASSPRP